MKSVILKVFAVTAAIAMCAAGAGAVLSDTLNNVLVYPNPFEVSLGHTAVTFDNLTADARLRIYKLNGEKVADIQSAEGEGAIVWDTTNEDGSRLATGIYTYLISSGSGKSAKGSVVILR